VIRSEKRKEIKKGIKKKESNWVTEKEPTKN
jgi:hypothetical protein